MKTFFLKAQRRGIALVTVLLFSGILLMMVLALFTSVRQELFVSQNFKDQTAALYLAETAIMDGVAQLEVDPGWTTGFVDKSIPGVSGTYTITFNTSGAGFTPLESVNNFDGTSEDNFRGAAMVPSGTVSLIATARVGRESRTMEVLVDVGGGVYPTDSAVLTTGKVAIKGDIQVDGRTAIGDSTPVDGDLHSNFNDPGSDLVTWDGSGTALFEGTVSSTGSNAAAVNLSGATPTGGIQTGAAQKSAPDINILAKIAAHSGAPPAVITPGTTILAPSGGDNKLFHSGDLILNGDLELQGVELYVDGNVTINGSIIGEGTVYSGGDTAFEGDARITAATPDKVGVFSEGHVTLTGFDGTAYMDSLAVSGSSFEQAWTQLGDSLEDYHTDLNGTPDFSAGSFIDSLSQEISGTSGSYFYPVTQTGRRHDVTGILLAELATQPPSSSRNKMQRKLTQINDLFYSFANGSADEINAINNLNAGRLVRGAFDAAIDRGETQHLPYMLGYVDNIDYNSLGSAYFQGMVFTHGSVYADSEVTILGALVARDNGSQAPITVAGETLNPGDVILGHKTKVRYIEEFFQPNNASGGAGGAGARISLWIAR